MTLASIYARIAESGVDEMRSISAEIVTATVWLMGRFLKTTKKRKMTIRNMGTTKQRMRMTTGKVIQSKCP
jgi:hypothetical protein